MSLRLKDPLLKRFIFLPGLVIFIGIFVFGLTGWLQVELLDSAEVEHSATTQKATRLLQKVRFLRNQESLFLQYGDQYATVMQKGLVQDFNRVLWVDGLLKIKQQLQLMPMIILIEPEVLIQKDDLKTQIIRKDIFYFTRINLSFGLQTDIDLFRMLNLISKEISPHFFVEKCKLELPYDKLKELSFNPLVGSIAGECSLLVFQAKPSPLKVDSHL